MPQSSSKSPALGIRHISFALPDIVRGNDVLIRDHDFDEKFLSDKLGISERRIIADEEASSDLAVAACEKLFAETGIDRAAVECVIVITQTPDYTLPHTAALIQHRLSLPTSVASFDVSLGCSGYVYGLGIITAFMAANDMNCGLLVTAETYSRLMTDNSRTTVPLFGDAGTATLIGPNPPYIAKKAVYATDGSGAEDLIVHGSGSRKEEQQPLFMAGRAVFNFMMNEVPGNIHQCLEQNGLAMEDVDLWIFHQASKHMLQSLTRYMKIDRSKVIVDMQDVGNTTSSSIPLVLQRNPLDPARHRNVVLSGFGVGLSWATILLQANEAES